MSYRLEVLVYNNGCEIEDNQGYKYYYSGYDDVYRTNSIENLLNAINSDLPDRELEGV